jgi:hypothetical protein
MGKFCRAENAHELMIRITHRTLGFNGTVSVGSLGGAGNYAVRSPLAPFVRLANV